MDSYISNGKVVLANKPLSNIELVDAVQHLRILKLQRCIFTRYVAQETQSKRMWHFEFRLQQRQRNALGGLVQKQRRQVLLRQLRSTTS